MLEGHGDDTHRYGGKVIHNFSSNVYYRGCPPELLDMLKSQVATVQSYPSPTADELSKAASSKFSLPSNHFLFTNGATEAFYLIAHIFCDKKTAIAAPTFSEYEDACKIHGLNYHLVDREDFIASDYELVFICNPNNPDGRVLQASKIKEMVEKATSTVFVIDEAYIEFTTHTTSLAAFVRELPNLIIVRSLTKTFTIPGIRLGFVIASPPIIAQLHSKKMPWSVNALAIQAGLKLFENYENWRFNPSQLLSETHTFITELSAIDWLEVQPTHTSYFLVKLHRGRAAELKDFLVIHHGLLVRDATNFHRLEGQYIRLSTQSPNANNALITALKCWN